jgi:hypothetical protein
MSALSELYGRLEDRIEDIREARSVSDQHLETVYLDEALDIADQIVAESTDSVFEYEVDCPDCDGAVQISANTNGMSFGKNIVHDICGCGFQVRV